MISISNKKLSFISKTTIIVLILYTLGFVSYRAISYYKIYFEKEALTNDLQLKKNETNSLKRLVDNSKKKIENIKKAYITKEELEPKVKEIFQRMSILDYELKYIDAQKMCLDRFIIVSQVSAKSEDGLKAAEGILGYIGKIKKSEKNSTIYFVDYIAKPKEVK
jgi:cell division protein FtsB